MTVWNIAASAGAGILGAMGLGGGGILIIYLTQILKYEQIRAQGLNLVFFIPTAIIALIIHIKNKLIDFRKIAPFILSALPGVCSGLYLTTVIKSRTLSVIFGFILIIMGIKELFGNNSKSKRD